MNGYSLHNTSNMAVPQLVGNKEHGKEITWPAIKCGSFNCFHVAAETPQPDFCYIMYQCVTQRQISHSHHIHIRKCRRNQKLYQEVEFSRLPQPLEIVESIKSL